MLIYAFVVHVLGLNSVQKSKHVRFILLMSRLSQVRTRLILMVVSLVITSLTLTFLNSTGHADIFSCNRVFGFPHISLNFFPVD